MGTRVRDSQYYLFRSEEMLTYADLMIDPIAKQTMRNVAKDYIQMAQMAQQMEKERIGNVVAMRKED